MVESTAEDILNVPWEATTFLAAVSACAVFLLLVFVYINKKWRIVNVSISTKRTSNSRLLVSANHNDISSKRPPLPFSSSGEAYAISPESSSDSEEDVLRRLRDQMSQRQVDPLVSDKGLSSRGSPLITSAVRSVSVDQASQYSSSHSHSKAHQHPLVQQRSFDLAYHPLHQSTPSTSSNAAVVHSVNPHHNSSSSSSIFTTTRPLRVSSRDIDDISYSSNSRRRAKGLMGSSSNTTRSGPDAGDIMSLAEKGKVNGGSSASSTSSNASADEEQLHRRHRRHHSHQGMIMRNHPIRVEHPRPLSVSSTSTTLVATPQPQIANILTQAQATPPPSASSASHSSAPPVQPQQQQQQHFRRMMPPRTKSLDSESPPPSEQGLSTYGDSIADQEDHLFEVEDMSLVEGDLGMVVESGREPSSQLQCGSVEVAFDYEAVARKMTVHVIQARGVPHKDIGGANNTQIRLVLLPERKQKQKTKVRPGENPSFIETFVFNKINPEDVSSLGIRFRLYGCERMRKERLLGECMVDFGSLHLELETTMWLNFEPRYHLSWDSKSETGSLARSDSASSTASIQGGIPELLVGLAYNGTTGRLTVEIIKGSHFRQLAGGRAPDSYVKLVLVSSSGQEIGRVKTSLRRAQSNPLFKETFMFQVALFQVQDVTLLVSVYGRKGVTRRELLGWFALGYNSSGDEESSHWDDTIEAQGDQMCRWHVLQA